MIILPDNDSAGEAHAEAIAITLRKLDIPVKIVKLPGLQEKEDVSDFVAKGGTKKDVLDLVASTQLASGSPRSFNKKENSANGFYVNENGVHSRIEDAPDRWICSKLEIVAQTRSTDNDNWGRLLKVYDSDGVPHTWAMPMEMLKGGGEEYRGHLLNLGLQMDTSQFGRNSLTRYIQTFKTTARARCVKRVGWHDKAFVLPNTVIQEPGTEQLYFQSEFVWKHGMESSGTLDDWRREVASKCTGNSRLILAACIGLAPPLLHLLNVEGGGVHLRGSSSIGKTTSLFISASAWGERAYIKNWRFTDNGIESAAAIHNHLPLLLDEIGQVDPKVAGDIAYMLANGQGKGRANKSGGARSLET
ncbi:MAG: DUF927 domain-containing protein, partial [Candidatus Obscuribacterales bacterium]|nr:DUF927 domain-containing protein [Candidatus Obscuribacterales bacterium]